MRLPLLSAVMSAVALVPAAARGQQAAGAAKAPAAAAPAPAEPACPVCPEPPPPPTTGAIQVDVWPADATLTLNGAVQAAGAPIAAKPGTHNIEVKAAGHEPWTHSFVLAAGKDHVFAARLAKVPPTPPRPAIVIDMKVPEGATLTLDGQAVTPKKGDAIEVEPGRHDLKLVQKGKKDWTQSVELAPGGRATYGTIEAAAADDGLGPYVTIGLGVGLGVLGAVFAAEGDGGGTESTAGASDTTDEDRATAAIVLYTVGGALVATGIALIALDAAGGDDEATPATATAPTSGWAPVVTADGAAVSGFFTF